MDELREQTVWWSPIRIEATPVYQEDGSETGRAAPRVGKEVYWRALVLRPRLMLLEFQRKNFQPPA